jgi:hypothetical protein
MTLPPAKPTAGAGLTTLGKVLLPPVSSNLTNSARLALNFKGLEYKTTWLEYPDIAPTLSPQFVLLSAMKHFKLTPQVSPKIRWELCLTPSPQYNFRMEHISWTKKLLFNA